jgi:transcriptional regulator with PAS, ATPase and Fis domain
MNHIAFSWIKEFPTAITVCDTDGIILEMNDKAALTSEKDGGMALIGKNLLDCHPDPARGKLEHLLETGQKNIYSIEKNGIKKLIFQSPWFINGKYAGLVEFSFEVPVDVPHFIRD